MHDHILTLDCRLKADGAELERAVANNENRTPAELRTEDVLVKRIGDAVASAEEALKRARVCGTDSSL